MADLEQERVTALWREAAARLAPVFERPKAQEVEGQEVEGTVPSQWLLDEKARRQRAEDERDWLREQLDAARQALGAAVAVAADVRRATYWEIGTGGGTVVAVQIPIAEWQALRAALGVVDAGKRNGKAAT